MRDCDDRSSRCWVDAAEWPGFSMMEVLFIHILCSRRKILAVPHISSTASRRTPCRKRTDLKEGTTDNTMANRTIPSGVCTDLKHKPVNLVVLYGPHQNMWSTTCSQPNENNPRGDLWSGLLSTCDEEENSAPQDANACNL